MDAKTTSPIIAVPSIKREPAADHLEETACLYENFPPAPFFKTEVASNEADDAGSKYGLCMTTPAVQENSTNHETGQAIRAHDQFKPDHLGETALTLDELIDFARTDSRKFPSFQKLPFGNGAIRQDPTQISHLLSLQQRIHDQEDCTAHFYFKYELWPETARGDRESH